MTVVPGGLRLPGQLVHRSESERSLTITLHLRLAAVSPDDKTLLRQLVERLSAVGTDDQPDRRGLPRFDHLDRPDDPESIRIDPDARTVSRGGSPIRLCRREYDLLLFFAENPGRVFTRAQLLDQVWNQPFTGLRTIDVHVRRLRHKLGAQQSMITTVYGVGYRLSTGAPVVVSAAQPRLDGASISVAPAAPPTNHLRQRAA